MEIYMEIHFMEVKKFVRVKFALVARWCHCPYQCQGRDQ